MPSTDTKTSSDPYFDTMELVRRQMTRTTTCISCQAAQRTFVTPILAAAAAAAAAAALLAGGVVYVL